MKHILKIVAGGLLLLAPAIAEAAQGISTANVNMRAGPSTRYPAVAVIPNGTPLQIRGCLADTPWCDVEFYGGRGWTRTSRRGRSADWGCSWSSSWT